jgi:hypothetical protein
MHRLAHEAECMTAVALRVVYSYLAGAVIAAALVIFNAPPDAPSTEIAPPAQREGAQASALGGSGTGPAPEAITSPAATPRPR